MQSKVLSNSNSLTPGNYSLYVRDESEGYPFQMIDKSITQMVLAAHTNETTAFITVRHHAPLVIKKAPLPKEIT